MNSRLTFPPCRSTTALQSLPAAAMRCAQALPFAALPAAALLIACALPWLAPASTSAAAAEPSPDDIGFFEAKIRPLLIGHCYECHSTRNKKAEGGLSVDSRSALLKGGDSGPAVVPGDTERSLLVVAVRQTDKDLRMPPKRKLSATEIADLETWVKRGAPQPPEMTARVPDPRVPSAPETAGASAPSTRPKYGVSLEEGRRFWSFQPVQNPPPPPVKNTAWSLTSIDPFILARLEAAGIAPAPPADKRMLLRRVTFDLTGLPPTPDEAAAFLADNSPQAFAQVVDRLLASPRYGERWGRHWLDVVRYADTCGNASDYPIPQAHKYRDWVVRALNRDLPYDQFLREQLAGDLLPSTGSSPNADAELNERIIATGYLAGARRFGGDRMGEHHLTLEDTIDNLGRAVLGSSIACARCHDHKFDPFTMADYYGLYGIFSSTRYPYPGAEVKRRQEDFVPLIGAHQIEALLRPHRERMAKNGAEIKTLEAAEAELKKLPDGDEKTKRLAVAAQALAAAKKQRTEIEASAPAINDAYAVAEAAPVNAKLHLRGDPKRLGEDVPRHYPAVLGGQALPNDFAESGRLQLAQWLTDPHNPLTARVMVNRIWQHHFGRGLVQTPDDFGRRGMPPTHPELLDHLATRFVASGWSLKAMHRLILLSQTWRQSSVETDRARELDPQNELRSRAARRRLDAESIRDSLLFVGGDLDESPPGPHPFPAQHTWNWSQHNPFSAVYESKHRSIYLMQQRLRKNPYLALFDGADPSSTTGLRLPSTTPLQALFLMNDPLVHDQAARFAARAMAAGGSKTGATESARIELARIEAAYALALNRPPSSDEQRQCAEFLRQYREQLTSLKTPADQVEAGAFSALARVLLSSNEFIFVD